MISGSDWMPLSAHFNHKCGDRRTDDTSVLVADAIEWRGADG